MTNEKLDKQKLKRNQVKITKQLNRMSQEKNYWMGIIDWSWQKSREHKETSKNLSNLKNRGKSERTVEHVPVEQY